MSQQFRKANAKHYNGATKKKDKTVALLDDQRTEYASLILTQLSVNKATVTEMCSWLPCHKTDAMIVLGDLVRQQKIHRCGWAGRDGVSVWELFPTT